VTSPRPTADPLFPLLDAAREGNDRALAALVRATQPVVWRVCEALGSGVDADDLVQDTYLRAIRAMATFRGDAPVQAWLLTIARRTCADAVRGRQRQRRLQQRVTQHHDSGALAAADGSIDDLVARLDPDRREVFVLTQQLGYSYDDVATIIGCPVGTVRSRLARARADLMAASRAAEAV
jgi:RNA polymerase sigma-70 factor, ECF subfamily